MSGPGSIPTPQQFPNAIPVIRITGYLQTTLPQFHGGLFTATLLDLE
jgi:hypothetical protein